MDPEDPKATEETEEAEEEEEDFENLREVYDKLLEFTSNEAEVKYLLPYQPAVVDIIMDQIVHMNTAIETAVAWHPFSIEQHKLELERMHYAVNNYLRTRLKKIETNAPHLIQLLRTNRPKADKYLSPLEAKYLDRYNDSIDTYMNEKVLKDMPENMQGFRLADMVSKQNEDAKFNYAFVLAKTESRLLDGESEVLLEPDVCRILTLSTVLRILEKNSRQFHLI